MTSLCGPLVGQNQFRGCRCSVWKPVWFGEFHGYLTAIQEGGVSFLMLLVQNIYATEGQRSCVNSMNKNSVVWQVSLQFTVGQSVKKHINMQLSLKRPIWVSKHCGLS
jgi:hypothetical protein